MATVGRRLARWLRGQHWTNRPTAAALAARCALTGHNYGQHFTAMGLAPAQYNERTWCDRCGREQHSRQVTEWRAAE